MTDLANRFQRLVWPATSVGGLLLIAFSLVTWTTSDEGVRPSITGLGRVSVPGATAADVAFLEQHTERPALVTLGLGALVFIAAAIGWWQPRARRWLTAVIMAAALVALVWTSIVLADLPAHFFDDRVTGALDGDAPSMTVGYGLIGSLVLAILLLGAMIFTALPGLTRSGGSS